MIRVMTRVITIFPCTHSPHRIQNAGIDKGQGFALPYGGCGHCSDSQSKLSAEALWVKSLMSAPLVSKLSSLATFHVNLRSLPSVVGDRLADIVRLDEDPSTMTGCRTDSLASGSSEAP